jgi:hypothetical protein
MREGEEYEGQSMLLAEHKSSCCAFQRQVTDVVALVSRANTTTTPKQMDLKRLKPIPREPCDVKLNVQPLMISAEPTN